MFELTARSDNSKPSCGFCIETGSSCIYTVSDTATYDSASLAILDRLSIIEALLRGTDQRAPATAQTLHDASNAISPVQAESSPATHEFLNPVPSLNVDLPSLSRVRTDTVLSWPIFHEALSSAKKYYFLDQDGRRDFTYLSNITLETYKEQGPSEMHLRSSNYSIDRIDIERLVDQFFLNTNTKNLILDRVTVRKYCKEIYEHGAMWNLSTCAVLLVCGLGSMAHGWEYAATSLEQHSLASVSRKNDNEIANSYYHAAEKRLGLALRTPGSLSVQCLCLAG